MAESDSLFGVTEPIRTFATGATRNTDHNKLDYEGFLSPIVLQRFAEYMHHHRMQADGNLRSSSNWQKGIPTDVYAKSLIRHVMQFWLKHDGFVARDEKGVELTVEETLCAIIFNAQGYLFERLKSFPIQSLTPPDIGLLKSVIPDDSKQYNPHGN